MKSLFITISTKFASISLYDDKGMSANINVNVKKNILNLVNRLNIFFI